MWKKIMWKKVTFIIAVKYFRLIKNILINIFRKKLFIKLYKNKTNWKNWKLNTI